MTDFNQELDKFDPTKAKLEAAAIEAAGIVAVDLTDSKAMSVVTEKRKELKTLRVNIGKTGKALREDAKNFSASVIAKEKELIAIIAPEEDRLAEIEERAKQAKLKEERRELLPKRMERLDAIGDNIEPVIEDAILDMDGPAFEGYFNKRMADKNEADRVALAEKTEAERVEREAKEKADAEIAEKKEAAEKAEKEAEEAEAKEKQRLIDEENEKKQAEIDAKAKEVEEKEAAVEAEKKRLADEEAARVAEEEKKKQAEEDRVKQEAAQKAHDEKLAEEDARYQQFLDDHGVIKGKEDLFHTVRNDNITTLYMKTGEFNHDEEKKTYIIARECKNIGKEAGDYYNDEYGKDYADLVANGVIKEEVIEN